MNLYFRFFILLIRRIIFPRRAGMFAMCQTTFWVNPLDLDINFHMNNGRYLSIMDLGRIDLMLRANAFYKLLVNGYFPVVTSEVIRFKKSLQPFQFFHLQTKIECFSEKDFFISQKFYCKGELYAEGLIKGRFRRRGVKASILTKELFHFLNLRQIDLHRDKKAELLTEMEQQLC